MSSSSGTKRKATQQPNDSKSTAKRLKQKYKNGSIEEQLNIGAGDEIIRTSSGREIIFNREEIINKLNEVDPNTYNLRDSRFDPFLQFQSRYLPVNAQFTLYDDVATPPDEDLTSTSSSTSSSSHSTNKSKPNARQRRRKWLFDENKNQDQDQADVVMTPVNHPTSTPSSSSSSNSSHSHSEKHPLARTLAPIRLPVHVPASAISGVHSDVPTPGLSRSDSGAKTPVLSRSDSGAKTPILSFDGTLISRSDSGAKTPDLSRSDSSLSRTDSGKIPRVNSKFFESMAPLTEEAGLSPSLSLPPLSPVNNDNARRTQNKKPGKK